MADISAPPRVVVLGGGYGGIYAALELQKAARRGQIELSLVSRNNFFLYQPMLAEVVSGSIEPTHILNPIRRLCPHASFHQAEIQAIDLEARQVIVSYRGRSRYTHLPYDHLIIAVGMGTDLSALPGLAEHAFPFKTMGDALRLRDHLIDILERAEVEDDAERRRDLLTFVVAGAGYTGIEVAAEINAFMREAVGSYSRLGKSDIRVVVLQSHERILPELTEDLAAFSHRIMEQRGVEIRLNTRIIGATAQSAIPSDGEAIRTATLVAAVGTAPTRLLDGLPCEHDDRGRIVVDETLAVPGYAGLWAVGDCAAIPDTLAGGTFPPTAQYAVREAKRVARNVLASVRGDAPRRFTYRSLGVFVPLGRFSGAAQVMGLKVSGFPAWWLYRTYYLSQLPRFERKLRVLIDWTLELIFRRDIARIDLSRSEGIARAHYEAGEVIFRQGDLARSFYIMLTGTVEVFRGEGDQEVAVATLGAGEYFGEMSLLSGELHKLHTASVRAQTPVDVLIMSGADFSSLAESTRFSELLAGVMRQRLEGTGVADSTQAPTRDSDDS